MKSLRFGAQISRISTGVRKLSLRSLQPAATPAGASPAVAPPAKTLRVLENMRFDTTFVRELPGDPEASNSLRQVFGALYSRVEPTPTQTDPYLVLHSEEVAEFLELDSDEPLRPEFALAFSGQVTLPGSTSYAQCYGGHQFGNWAGQLGDGRAITLGEVVNSKGERWELQLKGAGKTPYSRRADGRAVMRSSLREFIASEAMAALGVPTTRALSLVGTGAGVYRDLFYNGDVKLEPGAVVCRVAPSLVRFGSFQLPVSRGEKEAGLTRQLADYVIKHHYPHLAALEGEAKYLEWLGEVGERTARTVAHWQCVAFCHGVLNTDNMSILGQTIDYGPYGWMEAFDPNFTPNLTDYSGRRYTYQQQPEICQWNTIQLAEALMAADLMTDEKAVAEALNRYNRALVKEYSERMARKLGLESHNKDLAQGLQQLMYDDGADFTMTFRALGKVPAAAEEGEGVLPAALLAALPKGLTAERQQAWRLWLLQWREALKTGAAGKDDAERRKIQDAENPKYVPRNWVLQLAIDDAEKGDFEVAQRLYDVLKRPYDEQPEHETWAGPASEEMKKRPGVVCLSCSS